MKRFYALAVGIALVIAPAAARAANITWGAAQNISGDLDVDTTGTYLEAFNFGDTGVTATLVNGVFFLAGPLGSGGSNALGSASAPFSTLTPQYQALLSTGVDTIGSADFVFLNFTVGEKYELQVWSNVSNGQAAQNVFSDQAFHNVTLIGGTGVDGQLGQFAIGTFVADATTQHLLINGSTASDPIVFNGIQFRDLGPAVAVPLPNAAWAGLTMLPLILISQRRRRYAICGNR